ncbi:MAG TPA: esterase-like activity of phytase family protein, partial [Afifellaceae bacterium]|nr:esterase-like activity of phytase family protein [Afifellaceae bacterium]
DLVYQGDRLAAIRGVDIAKIFPDSDHGKDGNDAEDITVFGNPAMSAVISLERQYDPLIRFRLDGALLSSPEPVNVDEAVRNLPYNAGLESVTTFPASSPYAGALLAVSEGSHHRAGRHIDAWIVGVGAFRITARDNFKITAARFLPGGDLLLLERRFTAGQGIGMRLRRIAGDQIRLDAALDGKILLEAGLRQQIDNMEGLAVHRDARGRTIITMVSDDNGSILQRTLLLQFALIDDRQTVE